MIALDRIKSLLAAEAERLDWVAGLQVNSPVSVVTLHLNISTELYIDRVGEQGLVLSDGRLYDPYSGREDLGEHTARILIEPNAEDQAAYIARKYRKALTDFPWKHLTNGQLDAVLKFAESKRLHNVEPQAKAA